MSKQQIKIHYITWVLSVLVFLVISVIAFYIHVDTEEKINTQFSKNQLIMAKVIANELKSKIGLLVDDLENLKENPDTINMNIMNSPYFIRNNLKEVLHHGVAYNIIVLDEKDKIVYSLPENLDVEQLQNDYDFLTLNDNKQTLLDGSPILSDIYQLDTPRDYAASLYVPVFDNDNKYKGALGLLIQINKLREKYIEPLEAQSSYNLNIVNEVGVSIESTCKKLSGLHLYGNCLAPTCDIGKAGKEYGFFLDKVMLDKEGYSSYALGSELPGEELMVTKRFAAFTTLKIANRTWHVIVSVPYREVNFLLQKNFQYVFIILAVMFIFMLVVSYLHFELNRKRIREEEAEAHLNTETVLKSELTLSEEKYKMVMDDAFEGIALFRSIEIVEVNAAWAKMFEATPEDCIGKTIYDIFHYESLEQIKNFFVKSLVSTAIPIHQDIEVLTATGARRTHNISMARLSSSENLISVISRDVTEKRLDEDKLTEAKVQLEKANEELDFNINSIIHDIKTPLVAIQGVINVVDYELHKNGDTTNDESMSKINNNIIHMFELLDSLLILTKVGRTKKHVERIDLVKEIRIIKGVLGHIIEEKNAIVEINGNLPMIYVDKALITQVFSNLISNAIKFSQKGVQPVVTISCEETGDWLNFSVQDNGIGIDEGDFDNVFKIFGRINPSREVKGTGVGLNIVKKAVKKLDGKLDLQSKLGVGTTFTFTLPKSKNYFYLQKLRDFGENDRDKPKK